MASRAPPALRPWQAEPKYMRHVKISASAAMKMMAHAKAGVDKGLASPNRMPVEVMGFLHVAIDPTDPHVLMCVFRSAAAAGAASVLRRSPPISPAPAPAASLTPLKSTPTAARAPW